MMRYGLLYTITILWAILQCGCRDGVSKKNPLQLTPVSPDPTYIEADVRYYNYVIESDDPQLVAGLQKPICNFEDTVVGVLDALIVDSIQLQTIRSLVDSLKPLETSAQPIDARIVYVLSRRDGLTDSLVIGGRYTDLIFLNGQPVRKDNKTLYLLKNMIGFYPWIIGDDVFRMNELTDYSFQKAPFGSSVYYDKFSTEFVCH